MRNSAAQCRSLRLRLCLMTVLRRCLSLGAVPAVTRSSSQSSTRAFKCLAIDLSLSSISYAVRKTQELGITNIKYAQADILKLDDVARSFDIVESVGVLHHLAEPFTGWRILLSRLRPGGFMHLGFYSELARIHVVKAREFIAAHGYASTPEDIRRFRRDLTEQVANADLQWLSEISDFYSTSECRDLLFHVQEHTPNAGSDRVVP
jgi:SAM-dependent methyltransferase